MHLFKKIFLPVFIVFCLIAISFWVWASPRYVVPILMYHNVDYVNRGQANYVTPENFEKQMAFLNKNNYHVVTLDEVAQSIKQKQKLPPKSLAITFDDGYENNYVYAFPVLKKYQFPATIFLISDFIDTKGFLTLVEIQEMIKGGINFGSHTRRHRYLPRLSSEEIKDEVVESKRILEEKLSQKINYFAYPSGGFNKEIRDLIERSGYQGACTTNRGYVHYNRDIFELRRISMRDSDTVFVLWAKFSGYYNLFRKRKPPDKKGYNIANEEGIVVNEQ